MMKKIFFVSLLLTLALSSFAQMPIVPGLTNINAGYQWAKGKFIVFGMPVADTGTVLFIGQQTLRPQDSLVYYAVSTTVGTKRWRTMGTGASGTSSDTYTSPLQKITGTVSIKGLSGFGVNGQLIKTDGTQLSYFTPQYLTADSIANFGWLTRWPLRVKDSTVDVLEMQPFSGADSGYMTPSLWALKQGALTLTNVGTSGNATLVGNTLNIPNYGAGASGINSMNGLTGSSQTFATGSTGTDFNISSSGTVHTFHIPTTSSTNRGLVTPTLYNAWQAKESALSFSTGLTRASDVITWNGSQVRKNSTGSTFTRRRLNFIEGTGVTLTIADDSGSDEVDITINSSSGEANTASNLGGGLANWDSKSGVDLRFNTFTASDFNLGSNLISIDYTNGQAASASTKGFLTSSDFSTFLAKENALTFSTGLTRSTNTITWNGVQARKNSAGSTFTRRRINFIEGANISLTVADDSGNDEIDVTIASSGSGTTDTANLLLSPAGSGIEALYDNNDTLKHKTFGSGTFITPSVSSDSTIRHSLDTASAGLKAYIALYGNDGGGGMDSLQVVVHDTLATTNFFINSTLRRPVMRYGGFYYHLAITDSVAMNAPPPSGYDTDAQTYFTAVEATGATISAPHKQAYSDWVTAEKAASRYTKYIAIYPIMGGTAAAHAINAKAPGTNDLSFTGTWTHTASGMNSDGANGSYANTGITPSSSSMAQNSSHLSIYINQNNGNGYDISSYTTSSNPKLNIFGHNSNVYTNGNAAGDQVTAVSDLLGSIMVTRVASGDYYMVKNGTSTTKTITSTGLPTNPVHIGNCSCTVPAPSPKRYAFATVGTGLTSAEAVSATNNQITLETALGRN